MDLVNQRRRLRPFSRRETEPPLADMRRPRLKDIDRARAASVAYADAQGEDADGTIETAGFGSYI